MDRASPAAASAAAGTHCQQQLQQQQQHSKAEMRHAQPSVVADALAQHQQMPVNAHVFSCPSSHLRACIESSTHILYRGTLQTPTHSTHTYAHMQHCCACTRPLHLHLQHNRCVTAPHKRSFSTQTKQTRERVKPAAPVASRRPTTAAAPTTILAPAP
jgi:hypothetical protein